MTKITDPMVERVLDKIKYRNAFGDIANELVVKTIAHQKAKLVTYNILKGNGLPIPPNLREEIEVQI